jgi:hypothetical protein
MIGMWKAVSHWLYRPEMARAKSPENAEIEQQIVEPTVR